MAKLTDAAAERIGGPTPQPAINAELLDIVLVAELCGCSTRTVRRLADGGRMPQPLKLGALLRWRRAELMSWINGGCQPLRPAKATTR